jgi:transporter family protein
VRPRSACHWPVAQVATLNKLSIVLVAVLGATLLGERLSGINWLGIPTG